MIPKKSCKVLVNALKKIDLAVAIGNPINPTLPIYSIAGEESEENNLNLNTYVNELRDVVKKECKGVRPDPAISKMCTGWHFRQVDFGNKEFFDRFRKKLGLTDYVHRRGWSEDLDGTPVTWNYYWWINPKKNIFVWTHHNPRTAQLFQVPSDEPRKEGRVAWMEIATDNTNDIVRSVKALDDVIKSARKVDEKRPKEEKVFPHYHYSDSDRCTDASLARLINDEKHMRKSTLVENVSL